MVYIESLVAGDMEKYMLQYLNGYSQKRSSWLLMALTALLLELIALYFQHVMLLQPCVLCIYERCALFGILGAGIIGTIAPKTYLRWIALLLWLYSAYQGILLAWKHTLFQLYPSPFVTCDFFASFPPWLPLDKWLPAVFFASGDCSARQWQFLHLEMPQWLLIIFSAYLIVALLVSLAQWFKPKRRDLFGREFL